MSSVYNLLQLKKKHTKNQERIFCTASSILASAVQIPVTLACMFQQAFYFLACELQIGYPTPNTENKLLTIHGLICPTGKVGQTPILWKTHNKIYFFLWPSDCCSNSRPSERTKICRL